MSNLQTEATISVTIPVAELKDEIAKNLGINGDAAWLWVSQTSWNDLSEDALVRFVREGFRSWISRESTVVVSEILQDAIDFK